MMRQLVAFVENVLPDGWMCPEEAFYVNPTGTFVSVFDGDAGLTGKIIVIPMAVPRRMAAVRFPAKT